MGSYCQNKEKADSSANNLRHVATSVISTFFNGIKDGKYDNALQVLLSGNANIDLEDTLTKVLEMKFNAINETSGRFISYRLMREKSLGDDIDVFSFLVKYEKKFYRFLFTFYNNGINMNIYKFAFDDSIDIELEESIKLFMN